MPSAELRPPGAFTAPEPTERGGPDYGRFIAAIRALQDHARAADAPDAVIGQAADLIEEVGALLAPYAADEWTAPSGRRADLPDRGNLLPVSSHTERAGDRLVGTARFGRYHLGRNGAAHGGALGLLFDSLLGKTVAILTGSAHQRTAYLHIDYRAIVPIERDLQVDAALDSVEGRKIVVSGRLRDGDQVLTEARALFVRLKPGQP